MPSVIDTIKERNRRTKEEVESQTSTSDSPREEAKEPNYVEQAEKQAADDSAAREAKDKAAAAKDVAEARRKWDESHGKNVGEHGPMWNKLFK